MIHNLKKYFWDVDVNQLDHKKHQDYIISRILEYGDPGAVHWLFENFNKKMIKGTVLKHRDFSARSANFWGIIFNLNKNEIKCLKKSYQQKQKIHWPY
jgi:hypothetical protein